jgi:sterol desaturase/sphingolipid hydroxylase (fatty acid hydroxylase superfamily)
MAVKERFIRFRSFWIFPLLALILLTLSRQTELRSTWIALLWLVPMGFVLWTLLEYGLHRFAFHMDNRETVLGRILSSSHLGHHAAPRDPDKVLVHTSFAAPISILLLALLYGVTGDLFEAAGVMTGIWAGFLYYELVHYRVHCTASNFPFIARQRRVHFYHHFSNADYCFGVTTPVWDYVFGTARRTAQ